ncbi:MAG: hypothetical protein GEU88_05330 [Solirubrobacterales bacterium]|nr:hypothetical protein [Solirubrobacterales bacterium]
MDTHAREALRLANGVQGELGLSPVAALVKGERRDPERCPVARTIGMHEPGLDCAVDGDEVAVSVGAGARAVPAHTFAQPARAAWLVERFDAWSYRWLEASA